MEKKKKIKREARPKTATSDDAPPTARGPSSIYIRDVKLDKFADEYFKDMDPVKAAVAVGYSPTNAKSHGPALLRNPRVQSRIDYLRRKAAKKAEVSAEWVVAELAKLARVDLGDILFFGKDGQVHIRPEALEDPEISTALAEITIDDEIIENKRGKMTKRKGRVKTHDKTKALLELGKHLGLWPSNRVDLGVSGDANQSGVEIRITGGLPSSNK